jgi:hypothetical protein
VQQCRYGACSTRTRARHCDLDPWVYRLGNNYRCKTLLLCIPPTVSVHLIDHVL